MHYYYFCLLGRLVLEEPPPPPPPHAHTHFPKQRAFFGSLCFCHVLSVSDFRILIKSFSIESRIQFKEFPTHVWLAQLHKYQTSKPVMVRYELDSHWRQLLFFATSMPILYEKFRNVRFVLFAKASSGKI